MALNSKLIERFKALHFAKFGEAISDDAAEQQLKELADIVRLTSPREKEEKSA